MSKDPAFLFYSSDFLTGTLFFSMEERGEYITLLCIQHQQGHISKKDFFSITKPNSKVVSKYLIDENGLYYNQVLSKIVEKRKEFSLSRRNNRLGKTKESLTSEEQVNKTSKTSVKLMENENENEIVNIISFFNSTANKNYRTNSKETVGYINARLREGFTVDDFKTVIQKKVIEWTGTEFEKHLTPSTLFRQSNFEKYLNQSGNMIKASGNPSWARQDAQDLEQVLDNLKYSNLREIKDVGYRQGKLISSGDYEDVSGV